MQSEKQSLDCFYARMHQELVNINSTIKYLESIRDELAEGLESDPGFRLA